MSDPHFAKRTRKTEAASEITDSSPGDWVAFLPIDSAEPVMCNRQTLEYARPALYIQTTRDNPEFTTPCGNPGFRTSFTKAQLAAFVSSFYVQRLMVTKAVALDELVGIFEQQGVAFTWNQALPLEGRAFPSGVGVSRQLNTASSSVREACDVLARGVCYWSRLELCMDAALGSQLRPLPDSIDIHHYSNFDCTATRAWIRFQSKPSDANKKYSEGTCLSLVSEWPFWLDRLVRYLAVVFVENRLSGYNEKTFSQMEEAALNSSLHSLWWLQKDGPLACRKEGATPALQGRKDGTLHEIQRFSTFVKSRLADSSYTMAAPHQPTLPGFQTRHRPHTHQTDELHFARACVAFCLKTMKEATDYSALFSGACADDDGATLEREAFATALEPMHIKVIKWSDDPEKPRKPVMFPPYIRGFDFSQRDRDCPAVLLEFGSR